MWNTAVSPQPPDKFPAAAGAAPPAQNAEMFHVEHCIDKNIHTWPFPKWEGVDSIGVAGASRQGRLKGARRRLTSLRASFQDPGASQHPPSSR